MKKKMRLALILLVVVILAGCANDRLVAEMPCGGYTVKVFQTGDAAFPYGTTPIRCEVYAGNKKLTQTQFEMANDGKNADEDNFDAVFAEGVIFLTVYSEEEQDRVYVLVPGN